VWVSCISLTEVGKISVNRNFWRTDSALSESITPEIRFPFALKAVYSKTGMPNPTPKKMDGFKPVHFKCLLYIRTGAL